MKKFPLRFFFQVKAFCCYSRILFNKKNVVSKESPSQVCSIINKNQYDQIKELRTQELRILAEQCFVKKVNDIIIWSEIARNAINKCNDFKYFDALLLLSSFQKMNMMDKTLYSSFVDLFIKQMNLFEPKHFILLITLYCKVNIFPRVLFTNLFHTIIKYTNKFYPEEYVDLFTCFADLEIKNKDLIQTLSKSIIRNINLFTYLHISSIVSCLRTLHVSDDVLFYVLNEKQAKELKLLSTQELFDYIKQIKLLPYSWYVYEEELTKEFLKRINEFKTPKDVDTLEDPFLCLNYLISKNTLPNSFLLVLSKWCASKVYQYPSRSVKFPLSCQLIKLYELMKERKIENFDYIEKAIRRFVISRGGLESNRDKMEKPVLYQKGRKYIFTVDPIAQFHQKKNEEIEDDIPMQPKNNPEEEEKKEINLRDKYIHLSTEKKTEQKKGTFSNSRYCNFKLRQRPKRIKNQPVPVSV